MVNGLPGLGCSSSYRVSYPICATGLLPILQLTSLRPNKVARFPSVLILIGTLEDCADAFLDRVLRKDLPAALGLGEVPIHDVALRGVAFRPAGDCTEFVHLFFGCPIGLDHGTEAP